MLIQPKLAIKSSLTWKDTQGRTELFSEVLAVGERLYSIHSRFLWFTLENVYFVRQNFAANDWELFNLHLTNYTWIDNE